MRLPRAFCWVLVLSIPHIMMMVVSASRIVCQMSAGPVFLFNNSSVPIGSVILDIGNNCPLKNIGDGFFYAGVRLQSTTGDLQCMVLAFNQPGTFSCVTTILTDAALVFDDSNGFTGSILNPIFTTTVSACTGANIPAIMAENPFFFNTPFGSPKGILCSDVNGNHVRTGSAPTSSPTTSSPSITSSPTTTSSPTAASDGPQGVAATGFGGFLFIFITAVIGAVIALLMEYIRGLKTFYENQIRVGDRLLFRLKNRQRDVSPNPVKTIQLLVKASDMLESSNEAMRLFNELVNKLGVDYVPSFKEAAQKALSAYRLALFAVMQTASNNESQLDPPVVRPSQEPAQSTGKVMDDQLAILDAEIAAVVVTEEAIDSILRDLDAIFRDILAAMGGTQKEKLIQLIVKIQDLAGRLSHNAIGQAQTGISLQPMDDTWMQGLYSARHLPTGTYEPEGLAEDTTIKGVVSVTGINFAKAERLARGLIPRFLKPTSAINVQTRIRRIFPRVVLHPYFYGLVFLFFITIFLSFAGKIDRTNDGMDLNGRTAPGQFVGNQPFLLGGYGQTFLPVPPQYNLTEPSQSAAVPVLYGVMHCVLFCLGMLPIPFMRGFWRDISLRYPRISLYLPVDDFIFVHRMFAWSLFGGLLLGALIWLGTMGMECFGNGIAQACLAFNTSNGNPVNNVLVLRFIVWCLWFPIMPLMYFARRGAPGFLPFFVKKYWYEVIYYSHVFVGLGVVILALICRFTVFYPVIISWALYLLDYLREAWFSTHSLKLVRPSKAMRFKIFESRDKRPVSIRVHFELPDRFRGLYKAGQWVYMQIPGIDPHWHPFSIVSSMNEPVLSLHIGIQDDQKMLKLHGQRWEMPPKAKSWTYQLYDKLRGLPPNDDLCAKFRGPYGSAFMSCFNPAYTGCVVIGAGTGLTAAESVLKQIVFHKTLSEPCPEAVWFVWSCRRVDDLIWCWESLFDAIKSIVSNNVVCDSSLLNQPNADRYNTMDWLGITIYVTQLTSADLERMVEYAQSLLAIDDHVGRLITDWMLNQLIAGAMDDVDTNIKSLLSSFKKKLSILQPFKKPSMTVAYCGPSALATVISSAISEIGGNIEFSTDSQ